MQGTAAYTTAMLWCLREDTHMTQSFQCFKSCKAYSAELRNQRENGRETSD